VRSPGLSFVAPHVWLIDSKERRESNSLGGEGCSAQRQFQLRCCEEPGAKNLAEVMELQGAYWRKQLDILTLRRCEHGENDEG